MVMAPIVRGRKGEFKKEMETLVKHGYTRARIDGELVEPGRRRRDQSRQAEKSHDRSGD